MTDERDATREKGRDPPPDGDRLEDTEIRRSLPDGGATGADDVAVDPWGSATIADYRNLFEEFGIEEFDDILPAVPDPHYLMRRGVIFGHREYGSVAHALREGSEAAVLSGFMPTGEPHIAHKLVFDEIIWHQQRGADAYGLIADLEAHSARELPWSEIDEHARDYLLSLLALGFDPDAGELYRQSTNRVVQDLAFELGIQANFSELQAIYGFDGETDVSHMQSVIVQIADILYPQLDGPKPTVIPVGPDQDPHVRLARDLASRTRYFGVTEAYASFEADPGELDVLDRVYPDLSKMAGDAQTIRCIDAARYITDGEGAVAFEDRPDADGETRTPDPDASPESRIVTKLQNAGREPLRPRVRFLDQNATDAAFEALIESVDGEKRVYEAHVDAFDLSRPEAEELARTVELDHGGYGFYAPSSIYHRFMTGLTGGKMSSSVPASHISLLDAPKEGYEKVKAATTGGRETAELQRELGGRADECPVYELYAYLLAGGDDEFAKRVYDECVGGERLCGDCKEQAAQLMKEFLAEHQERREEARELLADLDVNIDPDRR